jgi:hypothetical protein
MVYPPDLGHIVTTGHKGICKPLSTSSRPGQRSSATLWRGSWPYGNGFRTTQEPSQPWGRPGPKYRGMGLITVIMMHTQACNQDKVRRTHSSIDICSSTRNNIIPWRVNIWRGAGYDVAPLTRPLWYILTTAAHCGARDGSVLVPTCVCGRGGYGHQHYVQVMHRVLGYRLLD